MGCLVWPGGFRSVGGAGVFSATGATGALSVTLPFMTWYLVFEVSFGSHVILNMHRMDRVRFSVPEGPFSAFVHPSTLFLPGPFLQWLVPMNSRICPAASDGMEIGSAGRCTVSCVGVHCSMDVCTHFPTSGPHTILLMTALVLGGIGWS